MNCASCAIPTSRPSATRAADCIELLVPARSYCERLKELGLLCKETHDFVIRLAPPLVISEEDLAWAVGQVRKAFEG